MRVFVTGHKGMVGSSIVRRFRTDHDVVTANRQQLNLMDPRGVRRFCREEGVEAVVHCAALVGGISFNAANQYRIYNENLHLAIGVIEGAADAGVETLCYMGSSCIYPRSAPQPLKPDYLLTSPLEPTNEGYALAKIQGVKMCQWIASELGYNYFSLMPCNLYGIGDRYCERQSHVIPALIKKFHEAKYKDEETVPLMGTGRSLREFLYVDDLADAVLTILGDAPPPAIVNVGSGTEKTIEFIAWEVALTVGYQGTIEFSKEYGPDGTPRKLLDSSYIRSRGWLPTTDITQGLRLAYKDYLERIHCQQH